MNKPAGLMVGQRQEYCSLERRTSFRTPPQAESIRIALIILLASQ
jgi:hypothetical protein